MYSSTTVKLTRIKKYIHRNYFLGTEGLLLFSQIQTQSLFPQVLIHSFKIGFLLRNISKMIALTERLFTIIKVQQTLTNPPTIHQTRWCVSLAFVAKQCHQCHYCSCYNILKIKYISLHLFVYIVLKPIKHKLKMIKYMERDIQEYILLAFIIVCVTCKPPNLAMQTPAKPVHSYSSLALSLKLMFTESQTFDSNQAAGVQRLLLILTFTIALLLPFFYTFISDVCNQMKKL